MNRRTFIQGTAAAIMTAPSVFDEPPAQQGIALVRDTTITIHQSYGLPGEPWFKELGSIILKTSDGKEVSRRYVPAD